MRIAVVDDRLALPETREHKLFRMMYDFPWVEYVFFTGKDETGKYSSKAVLRFLENTHVNGVLLDLAFGPEWFMGYEVLEELKRRENKIPVAMITNSGCDEVIEKCNHYGVRLLDPKLSMNPDEFEQDLKSLVLSE